MTDAKKKEQELVLLSAKTKSTLHTMTLHLAKFLKQKKNNVSLSDTAYTLQIGRAAMDERLAILAQNLDDLIEKLEYIINGKHSTKNMWIGTVKKNKDQKVDWNTEAESCINDYLEHRNLVKLAQSWINGYTVPWNKMFHHPGCKRIALPTYPFNGDIYWVKDFSSQAPSEGEPHNPTRLDLTMVSDEEGHGLDEKAFEELWNGEVNDLKFDMDAKLTDLDSLALIGLSLGLQQKYGLELGINELQSVCDTPRKIIQLEKIKSILIPGCDHFSILKKPELKNKLQEILSQS